MVILQKKFHRLETGNNSSFEIELTTVKFQFHEA